MVRALLKSEKSSADTEIAVAFAEGFVQIISLFFMASKNTSKSKRSDEAQLLALLKGIAQSSTRS